MEKTNKKIQACRNRYRDLIASLKEIDFIWPGTIQARKLTCGKKSCRCHTEANALHGPYFYWTTKVNNKTVSKMLTQDEVALLAPWIENRKRLEDVLKSLNLISQKAAAILLKKQTLLQKLSSH